MGRFCSGEKLGTCVLVTLQRGPQKAWVTRSGAGGEDAGGGLGHHCRVPGLVLLCLTKPAAWGSCPPAVLHRCSGRSHSIPGRGPSGERASLSSFPLFPLPSCLCSLAATPPCVPTQLTCLHAVSLGPCFVSASPLRDQVARNPLLQAGPPAEAGQGVGGGSGHGPPSPPRAPPLPGENKKGD